MVDPPFTEDQFLLFALSTSQTGAWELDLVDHTAFRTLEHDRIFGYAELLPEWTYEQFLGHVLPEDRAEVDRKFQQAVSTQSDWSFECRIRRVDGEVRWIWAAGRHRTDGSGQARRMAGIVQDITVRKRHETDLSIAQERLTLALQASKSGIWDWNMVTGQVVWSDELFRIFGVDSARMPASLDTWTRLMHPDDRQAAHDILQEAIRNREDLFNQYRIIRPTGDERWIHAYGKAIYDVEGQPLRMLGICIDVTETKILAEAARAAGEASQAKSAFLALMSHELRTPLNAVIGFTDVMLSGLSGPLNDEQRTQLSIVQKAGRQLLDIVSEVMEISRIEAGTLAIEIQPVPLAAVLREQCKQVELQAHERGLSLAEPDCDESIVVQADPRRLGQVVRNLLSNAIKFTDTGAVRVTVRVQDGMARVEVQDTGIGIPREQQHKLFQSFQRIELDPGASRPGTGLGLSISRRLIEAMGGTIGVDSESGCGSQFWFTLPAKAAPA